MTTRDTALGTDTADIGPTVPTARTATHAPVRDEVLVRAEGEVGEEALTRVRDRVSAALDRPGLPAARGEVRIVRASAHHAEHPWYASAEIRLGGDLLVVHAREAGPHALAERLHDRLRARVERAAHRADTARRSAAPPPWRGGPARDRQE
ncbi:hypothetical protein [Streptomyces mangrovisoli]|uniref:Uncharacterized protein n=1 Tax=Streptomyces mangrovisoli TaxID=1428628 RepID=A0A1J4P1Q2_9ACTN|nr:hypothetical protein [Streptomyces mangrovisoli]OIJ68687.1 hypothetical protein WN71_006550 [Streptomyces mangrovisoli]